MLLQIYMLIFKDISALLLIMSIVFIFEFFNTAFINIEMEWSLLLNLILPGFYYSYLIKTTGRALTYSAWWYFYGVLVNLAEVAVTVAIIYFKGRKHSGYKSDDELLIAEHVSAGYGKTQILKDISMDIHNGDSLALIGNNGCGKTTFIKCVLNQLKHKGLLKSVDTVAIIPQDDIVFFGLTVRQYFSCIGSLDMGLLDDMNLSSVMNCTYR